MPELALAEGLGPETQWVSGAGRIRNAKERRVSDVIELMKVGQMKVKILESPQNANLNVGLNVSL